MGKFIYSLIKTTMRTERKQNESKINPTIFADQQLNLKISQTILVLLFPRQLFFKSTRVVVLLLMIEVVHFLHLLEVGSVLVVDPRFVLLELLASLLILGSMFSLYFPFQVLCVFEVDC